MSKSAQFSLAVVDEQLRVAGALDFAAAARMAPALSKCMAELPASFTVDLSALGTFNSAVLVFLLDCVRLSAQADKHCRFVGITPDLRHMLEMASLADLVADLRPG